jgi:hypothetical protein
MKSMRALVDRGSIDLRGRGERIVQRLQRTWESRKREVPLPDGIRTDIDHLYSRGGSVPYSGIESLVRQGFDPIRQGLFGIGGTPVPYEEFSRMLADERQVGRE